MNKFNIGDHVEFTPYSFIWRQGVITKINDNIATIKYIDPQWNRELTTHLNINQLNIKG